jgi:hypothetical protein
VSDVLASVPLAQVRVAPGRLVINGEHFGYGDCTFTIEEGAEGGHFVIVTELVTFEEPPPRHPAPSRWERFLDWWRA